jgi:predicted SAM-dependent methyltransferase
MAVTRKLARLSVNRFTQLAAWARRNRRLKLSANGPVRVNLGCGLQVAKGWVNIDGSLNSFVAPAPRWILSLAYSCSGARQFYSKEFYCDTLRNNFFVHHNLHHGIPLADRTADFIYSSHFLEHLDRTSARRLLEECFRVLKEDGVLRIAVPDLEHAWEMYKDGDKDHMLQIFFFTEDETGLGQHRYAYDFKMLETLLSERGFARIQRAEFQQGATPDLEQLDNREDYTIFVEARRPHDNNKPAGVDV